MKVNFNLTDLYIVKYQPCEKCIFNKILNNYCGALPRTCLTDSQVYMPTINLSDIFRL